MLGTFCSDSQSSTYVHSSSNQMYIKFRNSGFSKGRGFSLTYAIGWHKLNNNKKIYIYLFWGRIKIKYFIVDCNVTIKGYQGAIEMAQQENMRSDKCEWTIIAPKGSQVNIAFTSLKLLQKRSTYFSHQVQSMSVNNKRNNSQLTVSIILYL